MLSLFARAAVRRSIPRVASSAVAVAKIANLAAVGMTLSRVPRLAPIATRGFVATPWARFPAARAVKTKKKPVATKAKGKKKPVKKLAKKPKKKVKATKVKKVKKVKKKTTASRLTKKKKPTPEQKLRKKLTLLRKIALKNPPRGKPSNGWLVYMMENLSKVEGKLSTDKTPVLGARFKALSEGEKARFLERGRANFESNKRAYKQYVESYPPEIIYAANKARRSLVRKYKQKHLPVFKDERQPKAVVSPYTVFVKLRYHDQPPGDSSSSIFRSLGVAWNNMSTAEREQINKDTMEKKEKYMKTIESYRTKAEQYWNQKGVPLAFKKPGFTGSS